MTFETKFKLGLNLRDKVTGLEGIADQVRVFLNGCIQYSIQPHGLTKEGKPKESYWIDEDQLIKKGKGLNDKPVKRSITGGPMEANTKY